MKPYLVSTVVCAAGILGSFHASAPVRESPELEGVLKPHRIVHLCAARDGILASVEVDCGDLVEAGQVVAKLDATVVEAAASLAKAHAELAAARQLAGVELETAKRRLSRRQSIAQDGAIAQDELDDLRVAVRRAEFELTRAEEDARIAELESDRARAVADLSLIKSPVSGVVVARHLSPGELFTQSAQADIVTIAELDPLMVEIDVPVDLLHAIKSGSRAEVIPAVPGEALRIATVSTVDPIVDTASNTFRVRLRLSNPDALLPAGLRCTVRFIP